MHEEFEDMSVYIISNVHWSGIFDNECFVKLIYHFYGLFKNRPFFIHRVSRTIDSQ